MNRYPLCSTGKGTRGFFVPWCLMMLFVTSTLIALERSRQADQLQRNASSEIRLHLESQINIITNRLNDCADRAVKKAKLQAQAPPDLTSLLQQTGTTQTALPWYPQIPKDQTSMNLADTRCPLSANPSDVERLFKSGDLTMPDSFLPWQYVNRPGTTGVSEVSIQLSVGAKGGLAEKSLQSLYDKQVRNLGSDTSIRLQKTDTAATLIIVLGSKK